VLREAAPAPDLAESASAAIPFGSAVVIDQHGAARIPASQLED
jgi:hypothetical protein